MQNSDLDQKSSTGTRHCPLDVVDGCLRFGVVVIKLRYRESPENYRQQLVFVLADDVEGLIHFHPVGLLGANIGPEEHNLARLH